MSPPFSSVSSFPCKNGTLPFQSVNTPAMFSTDFFTSQLVGPTTASRRPFPKRPLLKAGARPRRSHKSCSRIFHSVPETNLQRYLNDGKYIESVELLRDLVGIGYTPEDELCARLIDGLFISRNMSKFLQVIDIMETYGNPGPRTYSALVRANVMTRKPTWARAIFDRMVDRGILPEPFAFDFMIKGLVRNGELIEARRFHEEMLRNGFQPNALNYDEMIAGAVLLRGSDKVLKLLKEMKSSGIQHSEMLYAAIANGLCRQGHPDLGLDIFGKIEDLRAHHYIEVIDMLWNHGNQVRALQFTLEMLDKGIGPSVANYRMLISGLCKDGFVNEALSLLLDMDRSSFGADDVCYRNVIGGLCKQRRAYEAIELLAVMVEKGCRPWQSTYVCLITAIGLSGLKSEALYLANSLHAMKALSDESLGSISKRAFPHTASKNRRRNRR